MASLTICFQKFGEGKLLYNCNGCSVKAQFHLTILGIQPHFLYPTNNQYNFLVFDWIEEV